VNGDLRPLLDSIDFEKVPSSFQISIKELSRATGSSSPGETGTLIGQATLEFVLNLRGGQEDN
jgi:hypothetical protein